MTVAPPPASLGVDARWLELAVALGRRGWGQVHPNPLVGCVLVRFTAGDPPEGTLIAEGWHRRWGGPHAEIEALDAARSAGHDPAGTTAYVSLEPCHHWGKTPPCTRALQEAGVARVVFGAADPGDRSGGGGAALAAAGIQVRGPVFDGIRAHAENPAFFHAFGPLSDRPWVILKLAQSTEGFLAAAPGVRTRLTGPEADARVQYLRAGVDAILVGRGTALADDPRLTVRGSVRPRLPPRRVILDPAGEVTPQARLFQVDGGEVILVRACTTESEFEPETEPETGRGTEGAMTETPGPVGLPGARVECFEAPDRRFDLGAVLRRLRSLGIRSLLCEGGGEVSASLLAADLVDRLVLIRTSRAVGEAGVPSFPGWASPRWTPDEVPGWRKVDEEALAGPDRWTSWDRLRSEPASVPTSTVPPPSTPGSSARPSPALHPGATASSDSPSPVSRSPQR